jgi:hypothetical protein
VETRPNRRDLLKAAIGLAAGTASWAFGRTKDAGAEQSRAKENLFLLRYDTERGSPVVMKGFLEKVVEVHRSHQIPATLFCTGTALERMEMPFRSFYEEVKGDALFDIQDHSYSHIGLGYERGKPIPTLRPTTRDRLPFTSGCSAYGQSVSACAERVGETVMACRASTRLRNRERNWRWWRRWACG